MYNERILQEVAKSISVSIERYKAADQRYESLSDWLIRPESKVVKYAPHIYIHGSFSLDTAINPIEGEEFDLDIMCCLTKLTTSDITEYELKQLVGKEIALYAEKYGMELPEDRTRAWTINYSESSQFHMDVIPSIPIGMSNPVYLTYKDSDLYRQIHTPWEKVSNPKGFLEWFNSKSIENLQERRNVYAREKNVCIEAIGKHEIKSTLQEVVMLLKRHRDVFFHNAEENWIKDNKVLSIIITTLAGQYYSGQSNLAEAFVETVENIEQGIKYKSKGDIEYRNFIYNENFSIEDKDFQILNPSYPEENFTDKWKDESDKKRAFFMWLTQLKQDVKELKMLLLGESSKTKILYKMFGNGIKEAVKQFLCHDIIINESKYIKKLNFPLNWIENVNIRAYASYKNISHIHEAYLLGDQVESGDVINKDNNLLFVAQTTAFEPYDVYWQVANKGMEAIDEDGIRGEIIREPKKIYDKFSRYQRKEGAKYSGRHWIRCFVVKNNYCVAISDKFYVEVR